VGCHTDAYEQAKWFGDDLTVKADGFLVADPGPGWLLSHLGAGRGPLERARLGVAFVGATRRGAVIDLAALGWPPTGWHGASALARRCARACGRPLLLSRRWRPPFGTAITIYGAVAVLIGALDAFPSRP
jgi:hypothetical protein